MITEATLDLVARAKQGDSAAFQDLVTTWRRRIIGMVGRLIGRPDDAEDVAQDVFVRVYLSLDRLREPGQFEPWVYRIATNAALDYLRRHRRVRVRVSDLSEEQLMTAERAVSVREAAGQQQQRELADLAARVLGMLGPEDRSLMVLKEIEGLSIKEISSVFGVREEAVKVRLFRARQRVIQKVSRAGTTAVSRAVAARTLFASPLAAST